MHANVNFHQPSKVAYLNTPILNGKNAGHWLKSLIRTHDSNVNIEGPKIFKREFLAPSGIFIEKFNEYNLKDIVKNIVTINGDVNIHGDIDFEGDLHADVVALRGNLTTDNMNGCFLIDWLKYTWPIKNDFHYDNRKKFSYFFVIIFR